MTLPTPRPLSSPGTADVIDRIVLWTGVALVALSVGLTLTPQSDTFSNGTEAAPPQATAIRPA